ncbi:uncharacterized protein LOC144743361 isoform X2 [Ciona intestinalis]
MTTMETIKENGHNQYHNVNLSFQRSDATRSTFRQRMVLLVAVTPTCWGVFVVSNATVAMQWKGLTHQHARMTEMETQKEYGAPRHHFVHESLACRNTSTQ